MKTPDPLTFLVFNPAGLLVTGQHTAVSPAVHPLLMGEFTERHEQWYKSVYYRRGAFDGPRAVLRDFHFEHNTLSLRTAYRSYTEGLALRDCLRHARGRGLFPELAQTPARPCPELSWGMSLSCYVLLPRAHVLCAQRDINLISLPGLWTCSHTEVLEPTDLDARSMQPLLERLVTEELPALAGLGCQKFVGLGIRKESYVWQLVAVLDLRHVAAEPLAEAFTSLQPDTETSAWAAYPLEANVASRWYPEELRRPFDVPPLDLDLAKFLNRALPPC